MPLQVYRSGGLALNFRNDGSQTPVGWLSISGQVAQNGPEYSLYKNTVEIIIFPCGKNTLSVLGDAQKYVKKQSIQKGEIWCVYDKDDFPDKHFDGVVKRTKKLNGTNPDIQYCFLLQFA